MRHADALRAAGRIAPDRGKLHQPPDPVEPRAHEALRNQEVGERTDHRRDQPRDLLGADLQRTEDDIARRLQPLADPVVDREQVGRVRTRRHRRVDDEHRDRHDGDRRHSRPSARHRPLEGVDDLADAQHRVLDQAAMPGAEMMITAPIASFAA